MSFPIFNDEAIYLQYSQLIHADFGQYKLVSAGINPFADWKPPLQYWWGSLFVSIWPDPLFGGRLASFLVSLFGLFGVYLFTRELLGKKWATVAVFLYALCPPVLFHNNQFVAETFVFSLAPLMYWCFLRAIRTEEVRIQYLLAAILFGAMTLLSKQSGMVYLLLSPLLALAALGRREADGKWDWRGFFMRLAVIMAAAGLSVFISKLPISPESAQIRQQFDSKWLMAPSEVIAWPLQAWRTNLASVRDYYWSYYSVFILLPILYFFYITLRRREPANIVIGLGFLGGSAAVLFLLKGFNEYIYNTAVIVFLIPLLAAAFFAAWSATTSSRGIFRLVGILTLVSFAGLLAHWIYQDALMKISPADYIRRSTPWAISNYLENWSGGFGVAEAIAYIRKQEGPGLVLTDPQWGNPGTALKVYSVIPPRTMQVVSLTMDFLTPEGARAAREYILGQPFKTRLMVFSAARNEARSVWQDNVLKYICDDRKDIQVEPTQPPIVICAF